MSSESTIASVPDDAEGTYHREVIFPAGNSDFRAVRNRCARACREFNLTPDDADPEERSQKWLDIVRPDRDRTEDGILAVTHDQTFANPALKAKTPFIKPPVYIDYGLRLHVGGSTFINRNCMIMDTPVADIIIGEGCNIGANCCIIGVTHPVRLDERLQRNSIGQPVTIGNDVWIGANVTILGGTTIGHGAVIGACSLVTRDIPPMSVAFGSPARVVKYLKDIKPTVPGLALTCETLEGALALGNRLPLSSGLDSTLGLGLDSDGEGLGVKGRGMVGNGYTQRGAGRGMATERYYDNPRQPRGESDGLIYEDDADEEVDEDDLIGLHGNGAVDIPSRRRRPFSVGSGASSRTVRSGGSLRAAVAERLGGESDGEVRALLGHRRGRQQRGWRSRRYGIEAVAVMMVVVVLMTMLFFAGVYLGASKLLVFRSV